jgi:hypothetical protein
MDEDVRKLLARRFKANVDDVREEPFCHSASILFVALEVMILMGDSEVGHRCSTARLLHPNDNALVVAYDALFGDLWESGDV